jgi:crotonobetainyl-CoA:carnitine CoA-transferase CaiB-like acyl-CoA transferase
MTNTRPLAGVRILSIEQFAAGPYGTMLLAGLGAEVIRIENAAIGGDPSRHTGPYLLGEADSEYFQTWNLNKKSITLDLKSPQDLRRFERLVQGADAVVNNLRGDQPAKLGLEYAALGRIKPSIVCLHISAYGRDNGRTARPGYDYLMQAEGGLMSLTGEPQSPPTRFGAPSPIDYMTGLTAMVGLLSALLGARTTGKGCDVDVCLMDVALHLLGYAGTWALNGHEGASRQPRSAHYSVAPVQTFPTADGWVMVMCMTQKFWEALLEVMDRSDLGRDPRFATGPIRFENRDELTEVLDAEFRKRATHAWIEALAGVLPVAPVLGVAEALANPFVHEVGMVRTMGHPMKPDLKVMASPIKIDGDRGPTQPCAPLGASNDEVLAAETRA